MKVRKRHRGLLPCFIFAVILSGFPAHAMPVSVFDKMDARNQSHYITLLVRGVYENFKMQGNTQQAEKLLTFFEDMTATGGLYKFEKNLNLVRAVNSSNASDPNSKKPIYEVEYAFDLTLKNQGIIVPIKYLLTINKDFKPSGKP